MSEHKRTMDLKAASVLSFQSAQGQGGCYMSQESLANSERTTIPTHNLFPDIQSAHAFVTRRNDSRSASAQTAAAQSEPSEHNSAAEPSEDVFVEIPLEDTPTNVPTDHPYAADSQHVRYESTLSTFSTDEDAVPQLLNIGINPFRPLSLYRRISQTNPFRRFQPNTTASETSSAQYSNPFELDDASTASQSGNHAFESSAAESERGRDAHIAGLLSGAEARQVSPLRPFSLLPSAGASRTYHNANAGEALRQMSESLFNPGSSDGEESVADRESSSEDEVPRRLVPGRNKVPSQREAISGYGLIRASSSVYPDDEGDWETVADTTSVGADALRGANRSSVVTWDEELGGPPPALETFTYSSVGGPAPTQDYSVPARGQHRRGGNTTLGGARPEMGRTIDSPTPSLAAVGLRPEVTAAISPRGEQPPPLPVRSPSRNPFSAAVNFRPGFGLSASATPAPQHAIELQNLRAAGSSTPFRFAGPPSLLALRRNGHFLRRPRAPPLRPHRPHRGSSGPPPPPPASSPPAGALSNAPSEAGVEGQRELRPLILRSPTALRPSPTLRSGRLSDHELAAQISLSQSQQAAARARHRPTVAEIAAIMRPDPAYARSETASRRGDSQYDSTEHLWRIPTRNSPAQHTASRLRQSQAADADVENQGWSAEEKRGVAFFVLILCHIFPPTLALYGHGKFDSLVHLMSRRTQTPTARQKRYAKKMAWIAMVVILVGIVGIGVPFGVLRGISKTRKIRPRLVNTTIALRQLSCGEGMKRK
ncbi:hypothetical protein H2203_002727 [Taxawa tesnikishii (nom. ined.)]|nr:hypothetical protein H2203_002727 [Dothideales sp. JES 119]